MQGLDCIFLYIFYIPWWQIQISKYKIKTMIGLLLACGLFVLCGLITCIYILMGASRARKNTEKFDELERYR